MLPKVAQKDILVLFGLRAELLFGHLPPRRSSEADPRHAGDIISQLIWGTPWWLWGQRSGLLCLGG